MDTWLKQTKLRLQFASLFMMVMCPGLLIVFAGQTKRQIESARWPSVEGIVDGGIPKQTITKERKVRYAGRVAYHYSVDGQRYSSDLTDLGPGTWHDSQEEALNDVKEYQTGMTVPVYYDPHDPKTGMLVKGIPDVHLVLLVALSLGTVVSAIGSFFTIRSWLRLLRSREANATVAGAESSEGHTAPA